MKRQLIKDDFIEMLIQKSLAAHKESEPDWDHGEMIEHTVIEGEQERLLEITYEDNSTYRYALIDGNIIYRNMR